jgi:hypothetical protein
VTEGHSNGGVSPPAHCTARTASLSDAPAGAAGNLLTGGPDEFATMCHGVAMTVVPGQQRAYPSLNGRHRSSGTLSMGPADIADIGRSSTIALSRLAWSLHGALDKLDASPPLP